MTSKFMKVGWRGRVVIPVTVQEAAGIGPGDTVIVSTLGPGIVTIETQAAVRARVRAALPKSDIEHDAVADATGRSTR